ncbi:MAG TPA: response regulator [Candidatus Angelobacter sp.]|nr:response regulator [Candidatus Angelobacter sp.]
MILIADDNENDTLVIVKMLRAAGVKSRIITVGDGRDVIAYFQGKNEYADREKYPLPSVLLLDLKMAQIGGFGVLEWLNGTGLAKDVLSIILSGFGELENIRRGYQLGARSFLTKPCRLDEIQNLIRTYSSYWQAGAMVSEDQADRQDSLVEPA